MEGKKKVHLFAALITAVFLIFSFSSCKQKGGDSSSSSFSVENGSGNKYENFTKDNEEFFKDGSQVILTKSDVIFFLTSDGEVYGCGNSLYSEFFYSEDKSELDNKAMKLPIGEKIEKVMPANRMVFLYAETGNVYQINLDSSYPIFNYVGNENPNNLGLYTEGLPKQIDLSYFNEKIIDIAVSPYEKYAYLTTETGRVYLYSRREGYKELSMPEKMKKALLKEDEGFFLSETDKLYCLKKGEGETAILVAEKVSDIEICSGSVYYLSEGKAYGKGAVHNWLSLSEKLGEDEAEYTNKFRALNLPEKVYDIFYSQYDKSDPNKDGGGIGFLSESGKVYVVCREGDRNNGFKFFIESVYSVENIDKATSFVTKQGLLSDRFEYSNFEYAVKYEGEEWKVGCCTYVNDKPVMQLIPLSETPEWKN